MTIRSVRANNRKKAFEVKAGTRIYWYPYARLDVRPTKGDPIACIAVDPELGREAFTYALKSGAEASVHVDQVLDYNKDPGYLRDMLLYQLTLEVQRRVSASPLSTRELARRLGTSASQYYRLLDQTCTRKSVDQLLRLLCVLDCDVELTVRSSKVITSQPAAAQRG
jgi:predicted XRE-type DNA-binding protein